MNLRLNTSPSKKPFRSRSAFGDHPSGQRHAPSNNSLKSDTKCWTSSLEISNFGLFLTIITLIGAASATFIIPIIFVRTILLDITPEIRDAIRAGTINDFGVRLTHKSWPVFNYPKGADLILELVAKVERRIGETSEADKILFQESK